MISILKKRLERLEAMREQPQCSTVRQLLATDIKLLRERIAVEQGNKPKKPRKRFTKAAINTTKEIDWEKIKRFAGK